MNPCQITTTSQHRILEAVSIESLGQGGDLKDHIVPGPCHGQGETPLSRLCLKPHPCFMHQ